MTSVDRLRKETLKVAIIGIGKMGILHASILNTLPDVKLTAFCDKSALIRKFCTKLLPKVHVVDDLEKFSSLDLDAVYVTTPISSHYSVIKTIYSNEIARNVFAEKTLAANYDEAKELCKLAQHFAGVNMVGYMRRFAVTFRKAKDLLNEDSIGKVVSFNAYAYSSDFSDTKNNSKASMSRGGVLRDLGAHTIDLALWFFGDLNVDLAKIGSLNAAGSEDYAYFKVKNLDGLEGQFDISWVKENYRLPEFGLILRGSRGYIEVNDDKVELITGSAKNSVKWYRHDLNDSADFLLGSIEYFREDQHFIKSVLSGDRAEPSFHTSSKVDWIVDQVNRRARQE
jgi:predicted dehydrogenase